MKKLNKFDKIALLIGSILIWILVIIAIIYRINLQIGNYQISVYVGISNNILIYIILKTELKIRKNEKKEKI